MQVPWVALTTIPVQGRAYTDGLRGAYLFLNVPPEDRFPAYFENNQASAEKDRVQEFNAALDLRVKHFAMTHPDMSVTMFDAHSWFNDKLNNASQYGFTNITG